MPAPSPHSGAAADVSRPRRTAVRAARRCPAGRCIGARPAAAPPELAGELARRGTVLYIEDNPVNALIVRELLRRRPDLQLHVAATGLDGVQLAEALQPSLVLLDMQLPDIDGFEVLRRLRASPALAATPVVALSANAMEKDIQRALAAGMTAYWTKPLDFKTFTTSIDAMFGPPPAD